MIKRLRTMLTAALLAIALTLILTGCAGTPSGPPSAMEHRFYDITTNIVPRVVTTTNVIPVFATNVVVQTVTQTNSIGVAVPVFVTNAVIETRYQTNTVTETNLAETYTLSPNKTAQAVGAIGGAAGAPFGVGGLVSTGIAGLFAIWAGIRNRQYSGQNSMLEQTSGVLTQNIETLRNVIGNTPQGAQLGVLIKNYLIQHQAANGVVQQVSDIVDANVDGPAAKQAADEIAALLKQVSPTVVTVTPVKA